MIALSLLMAVGFLIAFIWSIKTGQQEDLITPGMRILTEEIDYQKTNKPL
jgi:cbb3-type cytochrome oxidase maturation protein